MAGLSLEYVRKQRHLPFVKRGMRVLLGSAQAGRITGGNRSGNLNVRLDGERHSGNAHPWYDIAYLDKDGTVLADFRGLSSEALDPYLRALEAKHGARVS